jgi:hypothetical protein
MSNVNANDDDENILHLSDIKPIFDEKYRQPEARPDIRNTQDAIAWLNITHFKTFLGGKFRVIRENPDGTLEIMEKKAFIDGHEQHRLNILSGETGNIKSTPISEVWLKSPNARFYKYGFSFDCSAPGHRNEKYNLWKGWRVKPVQGDVAPFMELMRDVICSGDEDNLRYLVALIAQMFQFPHLKPGIAVVIRSDEGVGKSFFVEHLCDLMAQYYFKTSNPAYVFGDHNGQLKDKVLLHL